MFWLIWEDQTSIFIKRSPSLNVCFDAGTKANWALPGLSSHIYANFFHAKCNIPARTSDSPLASFISFTWSSFFIMPCLNQAWLLMELCHHAICTGCSISLCHAYWSVLAHHAMPMGRFMPSCHACWSLHMPSCHAYWSVAPLMAMHAQQWLVTLDLAYTIPSFSSYLQDLHYSLSIAHQAITYCQV